MNPTPEQVECLKRACGTRRFIYNWGREQWEKQYQAYKLEQETTPEEQRVLKPPNAWVYLWVHLSMRKVAVRYA